MVGMGVKVVVQHSTCMVFDDDANDDVSTGDEVWRRLK